MRVKEFVVEDYSLFDLHREFFETVHRSGMIFEHQEEMDDLVKHLTTFTTEPPTVGNRYVYVSVHATPVMKYVNVAHFVTPFELVDIKNGRYIFDIMGTLKAFPEAGTISKGDLIAGVFTFGSITEYERMMTMTILRYSGDWKITFKEIGNTI